MSFYTKLTNLVGLNRVGKKRVNVYLDEKIHKAAQEEGFNISKTCEKALKEKVMLLRHGEIPKKDDSDPNS